MAAFYPPDLRDLVETHEVSWLVARDGTMCPALTLKPELRKVTFKGKIVLRIKRAENLHKATSFGKMDPIVTVKYGQFENKTVVAKNGHTAPEFNTVFEFPIDLQNADLEEFELTVAHVGKLSNDFIGKVKIPTFELVHLYAPTNEKPPRKQKKKEPAAAAAAAAPADQKKPADAKKPDGEGEALAEDGLWFELGRDNHQKTPAGRLLLSFRFIDSDPVKVAARAAREKEAAQAAMVERHKIDAAAADGLVAEQKAREEKLAKEKAAKDAADAEAAAKAAAAAPKPAATAPAAAAATTANPAPNSPPPAATTAAATAATPASPAAATTTPAATATPAPAIVTTGLDTKPANSPASPTAATVPSTPMSEKDKVAAAAAAAAAEMKAMADKADREAKEKWEKEQEDRKRQEIKDKIRGVGMGGIGAAIMGAKLQPRDAGAATSTGAGAAAASPDPKKPADPAAAGAAAAGATPAAGGDGKGPKSPIPPGAKSMISPGGLSGVVLKKADDKKALPAPRTAPGAAVPTGATTPAPAIATTPASLPPGAPVPTGATTPVAAVSSPRPGAPIPTGANNLPGLPALPNLPALPSLPNAGTPASPAKTEEKTKNVPEKEDPAAKVSVPLEPTLKPTSSAKKKKPSKKNTFKSNQPPLPKTPTAKAKK